MLSCNTYAKQLKQNPKYFNLILKYVNSNISSNIFEKIYLYLLCKFVRNVTVLKYIFIDYGNNYFDGKISTIFETYYLQINDHPGQSIHQSGTES